MRRSVITVVSLVVLALSGSFSLAGHPVPEKEIVTSEFPFEKGTRELQVLAGTFFSINHAPDLDYAIGTIRVGWMLSTPGAAGAFRGNAEFLVEVFGGGIFKGPGDGLAGAALLLRYNFVQPDAAIVPYVQIGAGGLYSDVSEDRVQRLIGSDFEFTLQAGLGLRFFLSERCALVLEGGYRHISNANLAARNTGVDSLGASLGFSYFY